LLSRFTTELKQSDHSRRQFKAALLFFCGVAVFAVIAGILFRQSPYQPPAGRMGIASDFPQGTWFNTEEPLSIFDQLRGHIVVVLFNDFNTLADLEDLNRLSDIDSTFAENPVACIVVSAGRQVSMTDSLVNQWQICFPVMADPDSTVMENFGVRALPAVIVIDTASRIAARYYEDWNRVPLEGVIYDLIDQGVATRSLALEKYNPCKRETIVNSNTE
jgi:hypothetical protein